MFDLKGKKALVTGGSRGIGRGIALALSSQGADLAINYRSKAAEAEEVVNLIKAEGRDAFSVQADVSDLESIKRMFDQVKNTWGKLDILVNNAGIVMMAKCEDMTLEQWDSVIDTNLRSQFLCSQQAVCLMPKGGRIINIASIASGGMGSGFGRIASYVASKGGSIGLTEDLAVEFGPRGINVNAIGPGVIETDMTKDILANPDAKTGYLTRIPKGRFGTPADIGAAAAFLASDEADYVTGHVLYVDGGWLSA